MYAVYDSISLMPWLWHRNSVECATASLMTMSRSFLSFFIHMLHHLFSLLPTPNCFDVFVGSSFEDEMTRSIWVCKVMSSNFATKHFQRPELKNVTAYRFVLLFLFYFIFHSIPFLAFVRSYLSLSIFLCSRFLFVSPNIFAQL